MCEELFIFEQWVSLNTLVKDTYVSQYCLLSQKVLPPVREFLLPPL